MRRAFNEIQREDILEENLNFAHIRYLPIYYGNVRSIPRKEDFRTNIGKSLYKVLCFTETWLNKEHYDDSYFPNGFNVYRLDRKTHAGGVAIIVHDDFKSNQITQIYDPECESICVKIELQPIPLVIYLAYVNKPNLGVFMRHCKLIEEVTIMEPESRIMVMGDFNLHDITWNLDDSENYYLPQDIATHESLYHQTAAEFLQKMHQLPMYQLSNLKNAAHNVLDLVFVNEINDVRLCEAPTVITKAKQTDKFHPPLEISFEYESGKIRSSSTETIELFSYKRGNYERMCQQLNEINFAQIFDRMDVEAAFDYFYEKLNSLILGNVPIIRIKKNNNKEKWWSKELQTKKNKRDKMYKRKPKNEMTEEYTEALFEFNELRDKLYDEYRKGVEEKIIENPVEFWRFVTSEDKDGQLVKCVSKTMYGILHTAKPSNYLQRMSVSKSLCYFGNLEVNY